MQNTVILRGRDLFGTTVVDNRFISELVPDAPENAVRVYLYGLMLAGGAVSSPVSISDALKLSDAQVAEAFRYWEKCGIVRIIDGSLLSVEYLNLSASLPDKRPVDNENAHYSKLVHRLQAVLGTRNMSGAELQKIYDWVEIFGFEDDAALLIVQHCIEKKGARVHINYMDSVAKRLVSEGRTTADSVAESFSMENDLASGAAAILKRWRNSRLPTEDELELYKKWTTQWGFSDEAIEIACRDVVAIDKPNFKYLDAILGKYHENGSVSPEKMRELLREQDMLAELARRAFARAGLKRTPTSSDRQQVELWCSDWCMNSELILYAAELASKKSTPFAEMKWMLSDWHERGIVSVSAAREETERSNAAHPAAAASKGKPVNRALNYKQRQYSAEELRALGVDLGDDVYED